MIEQLDENETMNSRHEWSYVRLNKVRVGWWSRESELVLVLTSSRNNMQVFSCFPKLGSTRYQSWKRREEMEKLKVYEKESEKE